MYSQEISVISFAIFYVLFLSVNDNSPSFMSFACSFFRACGGIGWNLRCDVTKGPLISEQHHQPDFSTTLSFSFFVFCCECRHKRALLWWFVDIFVCNQSCKVTRLESGMKNRSKEVRTRDLYAALRPKKRASYLAMRRPWRMFVLICRGEKIICHFIY